ncbi:von Willebrand factor A domain-containing protein 7-like [Heptranchias perlo]|uniref:von Willebrand factor A domain-containing protein 7-like n=1 Tax=Heptranchias perlo TaxID=212740 RepID=UPI00355A156E
MRVSMAGILLVLSSRGILSFLTSNGKGSVTHKMMTKTAALRITYTMFQQIPNFEGNVLPPNSFTDVELTAENLFQAYYGGTISACSFNQAVSDITSANIFVDYLYVFSAARHFDSETLVEGKAKILELLTSVVQNIRQDNFSSARKNMGRLLHTLQDFYSHSNWMEMGFRSPNSNIIQPDRDIGTRAAKDEETCSACSTSVCRNNILDNIISRKVLTTGYFNILPFGKPRGKCSHGGLLDATRLRDAKGGINKDSLSSPHSHLHKKAAEVATEATLEAFARIRDSVGDKLFLRFLNINSPSSLSFAIDTTGSMSDDISAVKQRTIAIIDSKQGTPQEPSFYTMVPFNDPGFGPVYKTTDPVLFKKYISALTVGGGGDTPELCLSGLQLLLTNAAPNSEVFVFTDAPVKDEYLKSTILALIEQTHSRVSFLLTNPSLRRRRRSNRRRFVRATSSALELYDSLAKASGGLAVKISKSEILELTSIIDESTSGALVTLLQFTNDRPDLQKPVICHVDVSLENVTIYVSGNPNNVIITDPKGVNQTVVEGSGSLATAKSFGNLQIIRLHSPIKPGDWNLQIRSYRAYSVRVSGQSLIDFSFNFVEAFEGPHPGLIPITGRPRAGIKATLMISLTGLSIYPNSSIIGLSLVDINGRTLENGTILNETESAETYLVEIESVPTISFFVLLRGHDGSGNVLQRQSTTLNSACNVTLKVEGDDIVLSGQEFNVSYTLTLEGPSTTYDLVVRNNQNFIHQISPSRVTIGVNTSAQGSAYFFVPNATEPGVTVTITIEASSAETGDFSYRILQVTVRDQVEDLSSPNCTIAQLLKTCSFNSSANCSREPWNMEARITDRGTGIANIYTRLGNGSLETREVETGEGNTTFVNYTASCCFPEVELIAVDLVGNVGKCVVKAEPPRSTGQCWSQPAIYRTVASCLLLCLLIFQ